MQAQNQEERKKQQQQALIQQQRIKCFYSSLNIAHTKYSRLYSTTPNPHYSPFLSHNCLFPYPSLTTPSSTTLPLNLQSLTVFKHVQKKPQQKLVHMHFLKDSNHIILGYDKQTDRGDINFLSVNELKPMDFYYNKLAIGIGGIECFKNGRTILISDKKGMFFYIDIFKTLNHLQIDYNKFDTGLEILDFSLGPAQNKIVCGLNDKKCVVLDLQKEKKSKKFVQLKCFDRHVYSVNSVDWHPYKSLVISSSIQLSDTVKLWDPHSQQLVHETSLHKAIVTKVEFHPQGNTYFSLGKDNIITQHQLRKRGCINTFNLQFQPTCMKVLNNNNILISDNGGYVNLFTRSGELLSRFGGNSGVSLFAMDQTNSVLVVGREKEHLFQVYCDKKYLRATTGN